MADISLSIAARSSLISLQQTTKLLNRTNDRLNSGLKVSNVADDPVAYFRAKGLTDRAGVFSERKDEIDQAISTMDATLGGLDGMTSMLKQMKGLINNMKSAATREEFDGFVSNVEELMDQYDKLAADATYNGVNLIAGTTNRLEVSFSDNITHRVTLVGEHLLSTRPPAATVSASARNNVFNNETLLNALRAATDLGDSFTKIEGYTRLLGFGFSFINKSSTSLYGYGKLIDAYIQNIGGAEAAAAGHALMANSLYAHKRQADAYAAAGFQSIAKSVYEADILPLLTAAQNLFDLDVDNVQDFIKKVMTVRDPNAGAIALGQDFRVYLGAAEIAAKRHLTRGVALSLLPKDANRTKLDELLKRAHMGLSVLMGGHASVVRLLEAFHEEGVIADGDVQKLDAAGQGELNAVEQFVKFLGTEVAGMPQSKLAGNSVFRGISGAFAGGQIAGLLQRYKEIYLILGTGAAPRFQNINHDAFNDFLNLFKVKEGGEGAAVVVAKSVALLMQKVFAPSHQLKISKVVDFDRAVNHASFWQGIYDARTLNHLAGSIGTFFAPLLNSLTHFAASVYNVASRFGAAGSKRTRLLASILGFTDWAFLLGHAFKDGYSVGTHGAKLALAMGAGGFDSKIVAAFYQVSAHLRTDFFSFVLDRDRSALEGGLNEVLHAEFFNVGLIGDDLQNVEGLQNYYQDRFVKRISTLTYFNVASQNLGGGGQGAARASLVGEGTTAMQKALDWLKKVDFATIYQSGELAKEVQVALDNMSAAEARLSSVQKNFGVTVALLETRLDFSEQYIQTLEIGAGKMTLADMNEEGANMMSLQSRQAMGFRALSIAGRQEQQVQQLIQ